MFQYSNQQNRPNQEICNNPKINPTINNQTQEIQGSNKVSNNEKKSTEKQISNLVGISVNNQKGNLNTLQKFPSQQITRQQFDVQTQPELQLLKQNQLVLQGNQFQLPFNSLQQQYPNKNFQSQSMHQPVCFSSEKNFQNLEVQQINPQLREPQRKYQRMFQDQLNFNQNHVAQNGILSDVKLQSQTLNKNFQESYQNKIQYSNSFNNNNSLDLQKRSQIQCKITSILEEKREEKMNISNQHQQNEQDILMSRPQIKLKNINNHQSNVPQPQNQETLIDEELFKRQVSKSAFKTIKDNCNSIQASYSIQENFNQQKPQQQNEQHNLDNFDIFNLSVLRTSKFSCFYCSNYIKEDSFGLNCLHHYHQVCLKEIILRQLQQGYGICGCICNKQIKQVQMIKILEGFGNNSKEKFFQNQVDLILKNYGHKIFQQ